MSNIFKILIFAPIVVYFSTSQVLAEEENSSDKYLFGDSGQVRANLENHGIEIESILTTEVVSNVDGGIKRKTRFLGNYDLTASLDTEKAGLWENGTFFTYILGNFGEAPSEIIGDSQVTSNIEAPETIKLYEAWYEHRIFGEAASVRLGLYDYNSEFDALSFSGALANSSFGIQRDISQAVPSIFPTTALAARLRVNPAENCYILGAIFDGIPGNPNNPRGTHISFGDDDGVFYGLEFGREGGEGVDYWKLAGGFWYHTATFEDFNGEMRDRNRGMYYIAEKRVLAEEDPEQGLGVFLQLGFAPESRNQVSQYYGAGFSYTGLIPDRDADALSFGVANAINGDDFVDTSEENSRAETALELNYRLALTEYFALTPDIQYVINPGTTKSVDDALVIGLRTEIAM